MKPPTYFHLRVFFVVVVGELVLTFFDNFNEPVWTDFKKSLTIVRLFFVKILVNGLRFTWHIGYTGRYVNSRCKGFR